MRKPRNYDEDLKALTAKARQLKARKQSQLGELVEATSADKLTIEELAGALLSIAAITDPARREAWRKRGAAFFSGERAEQASGPRTGDNARSAAPHDQHAASPGPATGAA
ncbi:conjugal transfer protein TraD [Novosphingobium capsulatum]|uniref:conjugal transfer protein TraD n=1 Tax=Novosphingobium capsulatum TaxID=13688 RepID=UPI0007887DCD|nr:conjugal transfer protein TraD [Novosphingobium capsulatum]WQD93537.1 conjugal transfer protein TraD [Novosphingobium capsulatum]